MDEEPTEQLLESDEFAAGNQEEESGVKGGLIEAGMNYGVSVTGSKSDGKESGGGKSDSKSGGKDSGGGKFNKVKMVKNLVKKAVPAVLVLIIGSFLLLFLGGNYIPDAILTRFVEETDVQYADAVQSKELVFQNAMENGKIPENTARKLEQAGVVVGYMDGDTFVASNVSPVILAANGDNIYFRDGSGTGGLPSNTVDRLEQSGVTVEYNSGDQSLVLKMGDKIITANEFYYEINHNTELYDAFTEATYGRAAGYYDESAQQVFKKIGTNRDNFSGDETLEETMDKLLGDNGVGFKDRTWHWLPNGWDLDGNGNVVGINSWEPVEDRFECTGNNVTQLVIWRNPIVSPLYDVETNELVGYMISGYDEVKGDYGCDGSSAENYMRSMAQANMSAGDNAQTIKNTSDSLKAADTLSKEQKSMLLYCAFMESISRMKAGYGNTTTETDKILAIFSTFGATYGESKINDVMNKLFETTTSTVVDVKTGDKLELKRSMLEAPSVYAILTGEKIKLDQVANYSSDRILKTINNNTDYKIDDDTILKTAAIKSKSNSSSVSRYTNDNKNVMPSGKVVEQKQGSNYNDGLYDADNIGLVELTIKNSMYTSFGELGGITAGELLAEGAVNVGKELAKASGAAAGDDGAILSYLKLNSDVLAMDAKVDRIHRSPFDITSKNTFLGSLIYKFAVSSLKSGSLLNKVATFSRVTNKAVASMLPAVYAEEESDAYLSTFGDCETIELIGAKGSPTCAMIATFDTDTYEENGESIYQSVNFQEYIKNNVKCNEDGTNCSVKETSDLAKYIGFNENRNTPIGLTDAAIYDDINEPTTWIGKQWRTIKDAFNTALNIEESINIPPEATGEAFVDSSNNHENWSDSGGPQYKYAQRYISLARAAAMMRQYDGDETAYVFDGFGKGNPIARYIEKLNQDEIASNN